MLRLSNFGGEVFTPSPVSGINLKNLNQKKLATKMLSLAMSDLAENSALSETDMFGFQRPNDWIQKDALVWIFDLNPDGADISFGWVCEQLEHDPEIFRRVIARNMPEEIKGTIRTLSFLVDEKTIQGVVHTMSNYVNLDEWEKGRQLPCYVRDLRH